MAHNENTIKIRILMGVISIIVLISGIVFTYAILTALAEANAKDIQELKPVVWKNERELIGVSIKLDHMDKRQERMDKKIDKILDKIK